MHKLGPLFLRALLYNCELFGLGKGEDGLILGVWPELSPKDELFKKRQDDRFQ